MEKPAGLCQNNESGTPHQGVAFAFLRGTCGFSPKTLQVGRSNQPNRNVVFSPQIQTGSQPHLSTLLCERNPPFFFPSSLKAVECVSRGRGRETTEGGKKKTGHLNCTWERLGRHDGDDRGCFWAEDYFPSRKKRRQELIMSLIHLKCWLILITLLQRDYERLTDTKLELNC